MGDPVTPVFRGEEACVREEEDRVSRSQMGGGCSAIAEDATGQQAVGSGAISYRGWLIAYDPPPIPSRECDWQFWHQNVDASLEGPEDGWVSNGLSGSAPSLEAAKAEIDEREDG